MEKRVRLTSELRARCTDEEKNALKLIADYEHLSPTLALRIIVREAAKQRELWSSAGGDNGNQPGV